MADEKMIDKIKRIMNTPEKIRNIAICAHIDHGKTTFSDNLLAGAGMISKQLAGQQCFLDFREDEIARGITIDAANVNMVHQYKNDEYLINLIDTPGHVDFGGDVTRAMRAVDGAIVLVDAVEGMMPQTETVLRQALRERVKPVLFINKVDRLIREVKLTPEDMQKRFLKIITDVNKFISSITPKEFKDTWNVDVQKGGVAFGSAVHKWALSFPYMKEHNLSFKTVIEHYSDETNMEKYKELADWAPLHAVVLDMVVIHHPNPKFAQIYRIPQIWHGDKESVEGKALMTCDSEGPVAFTCTKITIDRNAGEIAAGRLFSGRVRQGMELYMNQAKRRVRIQQVVVYKGPMREMVEEAVAGNIIGLMGLKDVFAGETISSDPIEPFEALKHIFEPVVTKAIEAKKPSYLPKLVEVLRQVNKEDPSITIEINEETGEHLMHGMGELHLDVIENRIKSEKGLEIVTSPPIVVYRESVTKTSPEVEGKSPNKHNKFYFTVEPLPEEIYESIKAGEIPSGKVTKKNELEIAQKFMEFGWDAKEARKIKDIINGCVFVENTRGVVHIGEVIELVIEGIEQVIVNGPLAREPGNKMLIRLLDTKLHEDAIHRGPAQVLPAVRSAVKQAMLAGGAVIYEPLQVLQIEAPASFMGEISKLVSNKRGQLLDMHQEGEHITVKAKMPVANMFGLSNDLRSATGGRGNYFVVDQVFEKLPFDLQDKVVRQVRERKGLKVDEDLQPQE